jgi:hypothetical protein
MNFVDKKDFTLAEIRQSPARSPGLSAQVPVLLIPLPISLAMTCASVVSPAREVGQQDMIQRGSLRCRAAAMNTQVFDDFLLTVKIVETQRSQGLVELAIRVHAFRISVV